MDASPDRTTQAWQYILNNWNCPRWIPIPEHHRTALKLPSNVGLCNGMIITFVGSKGILEFIQRINHRTH